MPDVFELKQKIGNYQNRYRLALKKKIELMKLRYEKCMKSRVFTDPKRNIQDKYIIIDNYIKRLESKMKTIHTDRKTKFVEIVSKLDTLSPLKTLTRGYSITEKDNEIIKSVKQLKENDKIKIRFQDGEKNAQIIK